MRILVVAPEWPPHVIGGGGAVFRRIAVDLGHRGHMVTAAPGNYTNANLLASAKTYRDDTIHVVELPLLPTPRFAAWLATALPPTAGALQTLRSLLRQKWDVAHLHGVGFPLIDYAASILHGAGTPYVFTIHGVPISPLRRGRIAAATMRSYLGVFTSRTLRNAAYVTAVSQSMLHNGVLDVPDGRVIYNGVDLDVPIPTRMASASLRLLSMSRLSQNKGLDIAIRAVSDLASRGIAVTYDLYGADGGDGAALQKLAKELGVDHLVHFKGRFEPHERSQVLSRYDVCLVPSRVEAFGLVALEAQISGLPVVAAANEGLREVLEPDSAVLLTSEDHRAWADAIALLTSEAERARYVQAGVRNAQRFAWPRIVDQYESLLELAARKGSSAR